MHRYLEAQVLKDLEKKMVFLGGPRQVGKTTLVRQLPGGQEGYLNWDVPGHRERILRGELPASNLVVFDELHKYRQWRSYLKGLYDADPAARRLLVTGSARLDLYRYGGDSLQGRYHYLRLYPLSVAELGLSTPGDLETLVTLGGFPEPFLSGSQTEARRWSREYRTRLVRDEVTSLEQTRELDQLERLMLRLPDLVASPLSVNALREDLQVSHKAVSSWLDIFERLYAIARINPFGGPRIRAVKKERKHYHLDWTLVSAPGPRFENLVAIHLLKYAAFRQDTEGFDMEVRYFRDIDGREVDFVLCQDQEPILFLECKLGDDDLSGGLRYLHAKYPRVPAFQVHLSGVKDYLTPDGIRVCPALTLLRSWV